MALLCQVGNTTLVSGNNNTILNFSITPRVVLLLGNRQISTGYTADASMTLGYGDNTIVGTISAEEVDNQTGGGCATLIAGYAFAGQTHCNEQVRTGSNTWWQFGTMPFSAQSATMTVGGGVPFPANNLINFLVLSSGTTNSITNVRSNNFNTNTTVGTQGTTGVGFKPDIVLFFWGSWTQTNQGANQAMSFGCGVATASGTGNQWAFGTAGQGPTNSNHKTIQRTDRCIIIGNLTTLDTDANFVSMDSDGFTIAIQTGGGRSVNVGWVAMKGAQFKVGSFNKNTGLAPVSDHINLGFAPEACFVATHGTVTSTAIQNDSTVSIGFADGINQANVWVGMKHGVATAGAHSRHLTNKAITIASGTTAGVTPTTIAEADINFSNTGINVNWTTNDATPDEILYWAVGNAVGPAQAAVVLQAVKRVKFW